MHDTILDQTYEYSESYDTSGELRSVTVTFENNYVKYSAERGNEWDVAFTYVDTDGFYESIELIRDATRVVEAHDFDVETPLDQ